MAKKADAVIELPVSFGNVSVGDEKCRIGIKISRGKEFSLAKADKLLSSNRLTGTLYGVGHNGDAKGQTVIPGAEVDFHGIFDVKGFSVSAKRLSCGLTFNITNTDLESLCQLAKRDGRIVIENVEELPED